MQLWILFLTIATMTIPAGAASPIRVMSFNVKFDAAAGEASEEKNAWISVDGKHRRDLLLKVVADYAPDILGVQEALKNQMRGLQATLTNHSVYGIGRDDGISKGEHCGIFFDSRRFSQVDQGTFWLTSTPEEAGSIFPDTCCARIASWVVLKDLQAGGREYFVLNTHWDHQFVEARLFSAQLIRERLGTLAKGWPIIVIGDLNAKRGEASYCCLVTAKRRGDVRLLDSYRCKHPMKQVGEGTYHGFRGKVDGARIDYIFFSRGFCVQEAEIIRTHDGERYPSDHFPVTATLVPRGR